MNLFLATIARDLRLTYRQKAQLLHAPAFFVLALVLFPLALGPEPQQLARIAPGLLTLSALFATLLTLDTIFRADASDGTLDLLLTGGSSMSLYVAGRLAAHWLASSLPLILISPALAVMLGLSLKASLQVPLILAPLTALLILIGALGAALSLGARGGNLLLGLIVLPLMIPALIFAAGALDQPTLIAQPFLFLIALLAFALPTAPLSTAAILRVSA